LIFLTSVTLLDSSFELIPLAVDDIEIIIRELAPLLLELPLLPVSFNPIQVFFGVPFESKTTFFPKLRSWLTSDEAAFLADVRFRLVSTCA